MRLSTRSRYGVRLMLHLAESNRKEPIYLKDIANSEEISEKYLSQLMIPLRAKGLVTTFRGVHGGYLLGKPASEISIRDIVEPLEGDLSLVDCVGNSDICYKTDVCASRELWNELSSVIIDFLDKYTLEDLAVKSKIIKNSFFSETTYYI